MFSPVNMYSLLICTLMSSDAADTNSRYIDFDVSGMLESIKKSIDKLSSFTARLHPFSSFSLMRDV